MTVPASSGGRWRDDIRAGKDVFNLDEVVVLAGCVEMGGDLLSDVRLQAWIDGSGGSDATR